MFWDHPTDPNSASKQLKLTDILMTVGACHMASSTPYSCHPCDPGTRRCLALKFPT